jgi:hypothetical protein
MAKGENDATQRVTLAERVTRYKIEVEQIVGLGIEHAQYELKRAATVRKEDIAERLDFVKLVQGLANADSSQERFIVIGADQKAKAFFSISNQQEFDPAAVQQIIAKYLHPVPAIEVFNTLQTANGDAYVLIVFAPDQPRPVVAVTEGVAGTKRHFNVGDIWIKQGTALLPAGKVDLDKMYEKRIDEEAESRARRRFEHYREQFGHTGWTQPVPQTPTRALLVGAKEQVKLFAEDVIASSNPARIKMLLEMARERLIDSWKSLQLTERGVPEDWHKWLGDVRGVYLDEFTPALDSVILLGLELVKYEAPREWMNWILDVLVEAFELARTFDRLKSYAIDQLPNAMLFAQPAYDVYVGVRAIATYAMMRKRFQPLGEILHRFVRSFTLDNQMNVDVPLIFWPFSGIEGFPDMRNGRNTTLWDARIGGAWGDYFGSLKDFLCAAYQLEFVLELNSYVFESAGDPNVAALKKLSNRSFAYLPDFWNVSLNEAVPIAEYLYDYLGSNPEFPADLAIDKKALDLVLKGKSSKDRQLFFGKFLGDLRAWQSQASWDARRGPRFYYWPGRLGEAEKSSTEARKIAATHQ